MTAKKSCKLSVAVPLNKKKLRSNSGKRILDFNIFCAFLVITLPKKSPTHKTQLEQIARN